MRKTFPLRPEGKHPDRVLEALKHELRKYFLRERRRALPEGVDFWDFDCKLGASQAEAAVVHPAELTRALDALVQAGGTEVYVEILAKHGHRRHEPRSETENQPSEAGKDSE